MIHIQKIIPSIAIAIIALCMSTSSITAQDYVIKLVTKDNNIGNVHAYISHSMVSVTLYGTKGHKTVKIYPGDRNGDAYWSNSKLGEITATSYTEKGRGKNEKTSNLNTNGDRNAWWKDTSYYFHVKTGDLGHIYRLKLDAKDTDNKSTKTLAIHHVSIFKGKRIGSSTYDYKFPSTNQVKITSTTKTYNAESFRISEISSPGKIEQNTFGEINYQDNLKGTGTRALSIERKQVSESTTSSSSSINQAFSIETTVSGTQGVMSGEVKGKYQRDVEKKFATTLSTSDSRTEAYSMEVEPKELVILLHRYNTKSEEYTASISFTAHTMKSGNMGKKNTIRSIVHWNGYNDYYQPLTDIPNSKAFDKKPTESELREFFNGLINADDLIRSIPHSDN